MNEEVKIYGTLRSATTDKKLAYSSEIWDDVAQKYQSEINRSIEATVSDSAHVYHLGADIAVLRNPDYTELESLLGTPAKLVNDIKERYIIMNGAENSSEILVSYLNLDGEDTVTLIQKSINGAEQTILYTYTVHYDLNGWSSYVVSAFQVVEGSQLEAHLNDTTNPHQVTLEQAGLEVIHLSNAIRDLTSDSYEDEIRDALGGKQEIEKIINALKLEKAVLFDIQISDESKEGVIPVNVVGNSTSLEISWVYKEISTTLLILVDLFMDSYTAKRKDIGLSDTMMILDREVVGPTIEQDFWDRLTTAINANRVVVYKNTANGKVGPVTYMKAEDDSYVKLYITLCSDEEADPFELSYSYVYIQRATLAVSGFSHSLNFFTQGEGKKFLADNGQYVLTPVFADLTQENLNFGKLSENKVSSIKQAIAENRVIAIPDATSKSVCVASAKETEEGNIVLVLPKYSDSFDFQKYLVDSESGMVSVEELNLTNKGDGKEVLTNDGTYSAIQDIIEIPLTNEGSGSNVLTDKGEYKTVQDITGIPFTKEGDGSLVLTDDGTYKSVSQSIGVDLKAMETQVETNKTDIADLTGKIGQPNGLATLDLTGKVPASQLPSYVDDVVELEAFLVIPPDMGMVPGNKYYISSTKKIFIATDEYTGEEFAPEKDKVYVDKRDSKTYRWSGQDMVVIGTDLALGETSSTAFPGDKGKEVSDHLDQVQGFLDQQFDANVEGSLAAQVKANKDNNIDQYHKIDHNAVEIEKNSLRLDQHELVHTQHQNAIDKNATDIAAIQEQIGGSGEGDSLISKIEKNAADIATNLQSIETIQEDLNPDTPDSTGSKVKKNAEDIAAVNELVATNDTEHRELIQANKDEIAANKTAIDKNAEDIVALQGELDIDTPDTLAYKINKNTQDISDTKTSVSNLTDKHNTDIALVQQTIRDNQTSHDSDIADVRGELKDVADKHDKEKEEIDTTITELALRHDTELAEANTAILENKDNLAQEISDRVVLQGIVEDNVERITEVERLFPFTYLGPFRQDYVTLLGNPRNVNSQPYDPDTNPYIIGVEYISHVMTIEGESVYDLYQPAFFNVYTKSISSPVGVFGSLLNEILLHKKFTDLIIKDGDGTQVLTDNGLYRDILSDAIIELPNGVLNLQPTSTSDVIKSTFGGLAKLEATIDKIREAKNIIPAILVSSEFETGRIPVRLIGTIYMNEKRLTLCWTSGVIYTEITITILANNCSVTRTDIDLSLKENFLFTANDLDLENLNLLNSVTGDFFTKLKDAIGKQKVIVYSRDPEASDSIITPVEAEYFADGSVGIHFHQHEIAETGLNIISRYAIVAPDLSVSNKKLDFSLITNGDASKVLSDDGHYYTVNQIVGVDIPALKQDVITNAAGIKRIMDSVNKPNGIAGIDPDGKIPGYLLPGYIDDVTDLEGGIVEEIPTEGMIPGVRYYVRSIKKIYTATSDTLGVESVPESDKVYIDCITDKTYRWSGRDLVVIGSDLALGETSSTAYPGHLGKQNADNITEISENLNPDVEGSLGAEVKKNTADIAQEIEDRETLATHVDTEDNAIKNRLDKIEDLYPIQWVPSYTSDIHDYYGDPDLLDGKAYDVDLNTYVLNDPYILAHIHPYTTEDGRQAFHYQMYSFTYLELDTRANLQEPAEIFGILLNKLKQRTDNLRYDGDGSMVLTNNGKYSTVADLIPSSLEQIQANKEGVAANLAAIKANKAEIDLINADLDPIVPESTGNKVKNLRTDLDAEVKRVDDQLDVNVNGSLAAKIKKNEDDITTANTTHANDLATINNYTVNTKKISETPVLDGRDIKLDGYVTSELENEDLVLKETDTINVAFGKMEKAIIDNEIVTSEMGNDLNSRLLVIEGHDIITTSLPESIVSEVTDITPEANKVVVTYEGYRKDVTGQYKPITSSFEIPEATPTTAGVTRAEDKEMLDTLKDLVLNDKIVMTCNCVPSIIEKGAPTSVKVTCITRFNGTTVNATDEVLMKGEDELSLAAGSFVDTVSDTTTYSYTATYFGVTKTVTGRVLTYYPMFFGSFADTTITSSDILGLHKQAPVSSPKGSYSLMSSASQYVWLCVPQGMTISKVTSFGFDVPFEKPVVVEVEGKGNYTCYRSSEMFKASEFNFVIE